MLGRVSAPAITAGHDAGPLPLLHGTHAKAWNRKRQTDLLLHRLPPPCKRPTAAEAEANTLEDQARQGTAGTANGRGIT
jgi:hypothetical protein